MYYNQEKDILHIYSSELIYEFSVSEDTIKYGLKLNRKGSSSWSYITDPLDKRCRLIDYDSIPPKTKSKLPSREELVSKAKVEEIKQRYRQSLSKASRLIEAQDDFINPTDLHYFMKYVSNDQAQDLTQAAAWLRLLVAHQYKRDTQKLNYESKAALRDDVVLHLINYPLYGFSIQSVEVLQRRELKWSKDYQTALEQYSNLPKVKQQLQANNATIHTLIPEYLDNMNRLIIGKPTHTEHDVIIGKNINIAEWHASTAITLYLNTGSGSKFDLEEIYRRYVMLCAREGKEVLNDSTIKKFLTRKEVVQFAMKERHGWEHYDKVLPYTHRNRPNWSLSKGGIDGLQVDFYTKDGSSRIMLTVVAMFDYHSEAITGFDVGIVEDGQMARNTQRHHLLMTGGRAFMELESDHGSAFISKESTKVLEAMNHKLTLSGFLGDDVQKKRSNSKSRFVERLVQELNRLTQSFEGWKGTNFYTKDLSRRPNEDYKKVPKKNLAEGIQQIIQLVNIYNNSRLEKYERKSRIERCREDIHPKSMEVPMYSIALMLRQSTVATIKGGHIAMQVNRKKYEYHYPNFNDDIAYLLKGYKVHVYYDENDMNTVEIFGENDHYLGTLQKLDRAQTATFEQTEKDKKLLGYYDRQRKEAIEKNDRKVLEFFASKYGVDISTMDTEEARQVIAAQHELHKGETVVPVEERFAEELATAEAETATKFYNDRLLRSRDMQVPKRKPVKSDEQWKKEERKRRLDEFRKNQQPGQGAAE